MAVIFLQNNLRINNRLNIGNCWSVFAIKESFGPPHEKTGFWPICENKDADQLRGNHEADQRLCIRYTDSTMPLLLKTGISMF